MLAPMQLALEPFPSERHAVAPHFFAVPVTCGPSPMRRHETRIALRPAA